MNIKEKIKKAENFLAKQPAHQKKINKQFDKTQDFDLFEEINLYYDKAYDELFPIVKAVEEKSLTVEDAYDLFSVYYLLNETLMGLENMDFASYIEKYLTEMWKITTQNIEKLETTTTQTYKYLKIREKENICIDSNINTFRELSEKITIRDKKINEILVTFKTQLGEIKLYE